MRLLALSLCLLTSTASFGQNTLVVRGQQLYSGVGLSTSQLYVERQTGGVPTTTGSLTVSLTTSSSTGQFNDFPYRATGWTPSLSVTIPNGQSQAPFVYRDLANGFQTVSLAASGYTTATAQLGFINDIFASDFEGTLFTTDTPAGPWHSGAIAVSTMNSVDISASAAHRGSGGLRVIDTADAGAPELEGQVSVNLQGDGPDLYFRGWVRFSTFALDGGDETVFSATSNSGRTVLSLALNSAGHYVISGSDRNGNVQTTDCTGGGGQTSFALVELSASGLGTSSGTRTAWFDAVQCTQQTNIDWTGELVTAFNLGEPMSQQRTFTGEVYWDDFRVTTYPPASRPVAVFPSQFEVGSCTAGAVRLMDSRGFAAPAPYDMTVTVAGGIGTSLFTDANCTLPFPGTLLIPGGNNSAALYVKATNVGPVNFGTGHLDLMAGGGSSTVVPAGTLDAGTDGGFDAGVADGGSDAGLDDGGVADAGEVDAGALDAGELDAGDGGQADAGETTPGEHRTTRVGCDCDSASSLPILGAALLALSLRRRRIGPQ